MASAQEAAKKKFAGLFGKEHGDAGGHDKSSEEPDKNDDRMDGADGMDGEDGEDGYGGEEEKTDGDGYDLSACANDIMAAVKANDVDALKEALEELMEKVRE